MGNFKAFRAGDLQPFLKYYLAANSAEYDRISAGRKCYNTMRTNRGEEDEFTVSQNFGKWSKDAESGTRRLQDDGA